MRGRQKNYWLLLSTTQQPGKCPYLGQYEVSHVIKVSGQRSRPFQRWEQYCKLRMWGEPGAVREYSPILIFGLPRGSSYQALLVAIHWLEIRRCSKSSSRFVLKCMEALANHIVSPEFMGLRTTHEQMKPPVSTLCGDDSAVPEELQSVGSMPDHINVVATDRLERGYMQYGCSHYRRRCRIRSPCCNEIYDCRHCHNEAKNSIFVEKLQRHDIPRHQVQQVICSLCGTEQEVHQVCINCGVCMGKYFCETCKLFDDDISKEQYHCSGCEICRIGGRENFFHCYKCGCCYSGLYKNTHPCVERAMHHNCPVCFEYLFESTNDVSVLPCGHTIHVDCLKEMQQHFQYACPLCSKSVCDMSKVWEKIDMEIAATPMPEQYQNKMVWILCNDCGEKSLVQFHVVAQKCLKCKSYNTRQTRGVTER